MEHNPSFDAVQARIQDYYQKGEFGAALHEASTQAGRFPEHVPLFTYWRICMTARLGRTAQSMRILHDSLQQGLWFSEFLLRKSPSLKTLQGLAAFERLVVRNKTMQDEDEDLHFPVITLRSPGNCTKGSRACRLLLALHGDSSTAAASVDFWQAAAGYGWLVGLPQSRQAMWKGAYLWDDREAACTQLETQLAALLKQYAIDPERVVLAGQSMGGETAIWLALSGALPTAGFIAIGPGGPLMDEPDAWQPYIEQAQARIEESGQPLRGLIIYGDADDSISPTGVQTLAAHLERAGILCNLEAIPGAQHGFVPEYGAALLRGLDEFEDFWSGDAGLET